ncbi:CAP domain-containing protein [Halomonas aquamarina]|uniref:CAP domain-containing protein n=1 Tax=Vreelandella aquamarina TaxID=77097 RepID=A0ACC5VQG8_9GAMM|nr:CAP domain-containing protein [Halomonas aquamarina]MBZ5486500.1 CAP domain-containing protein [Halomonas aquamarina]
MKNSAVDSSARRPALGALFRCLALVLLGTGPAWASEPSECEPTEQQQAMLDLVNEARSQARQCGEQSVDAVAPLAWSCQLHDAAKAHSDDMAENGYFSHTSPEGVGIEQRVEDQGYVWRAVGENIAAGQSSAAGAVKGWLESPGHCRNIMNGAFTQMGMAKADNPETRYRHYWTQALGQPR